MNSLIQSLSNVDWSKLFIGCKDTDAYAQRFHDTLQTALSGARYTTVKRSCPNLPVILSFTKTKVIVNEKITLSLTKTETETRKFELTRTE